MIVTPSFTCYSGSPIIVTYNAKLEGIAEENSTTLINSLLEEWMEIDKTIAGVTMTVDSDCNETDSLDVVSESDCDSQNNVDNSIITIAVGGGIVVVLLFLVVIIALIVVLKRWNHRLVHKKE